MKVGYKDMRGNFIWPTSVLCEAHQTQANADRVTRLMLAYNTSAYPVWLEGDEAKTPCTICKEVEAL